MFVSNDGGIPEKYKASVLTRLCGVEIPEDNVLLSHTPFRDIHESIKRSRVMLLGTYRDKGFQVARNYGFTNYVWFEDYLDRHPYLLSRHSPRVLNPNPDAVNEIVPQEEICNEEPFGAILVLHDPMNWYEGLQLCLDIVLGNGSLGHISETHTLPVYISNPDMEYSAEFLQPRITSGSFALCLKSLYRAKTGLELTTLQQSGKPLRYTYDYVIRHLGIEPERLYMVGDNPKSDIRGANQMGMFSILVRTGCFQGGDNDETYPAKLVCQNLEEAVQFILKGEGTSN